MLKAQTAFRKLPTLRREQGGPSQPLGWRRVGFCRRLGGRHGVDAAANDKHRKPKPLNSKWGRRHFWAKIPLFLQVSQFPLVTHCPVRRLSGRAGGLGEEAVFPAPRRPATLGQRDSQSEQAGDEGAMGGDVRRWPGGLRSVPPPGPAASLCLDLRTLTPPPPAFHTGPGRKTGNSPQSYRTRVCRGKQVHHVLNVLVLSD